MLAPKHSKDGFSGSHTFSRDLTNIAHLLPKESAKGGYLLAKTSRDGNNHSVQGVKKDPSNGDVLSRTGKSWSIIFISRRALAREGDYEMMPVCACMRVCIS